MPRAAAKSPFIGPELDAIRIGDPCEVDICGHRFKGIVQRKARASIFVLWGTTNVLTRFRRTSDGGWRWVKAYLVFQ